MSGRRLCGSCATIDVSARRIIGWAIAASLDAEALLCRLSSGRPRKEAPRDGLVNHSDRTTTTSCQPATSRRFQRESRSCSDLPGPTTTTPWLRPSTISKGRAHRPGQHPTLDYPRPMSPPSAGSPGGTQNDAMKLSDAAPRRCRSGLRPTTTAPAAVPTTKQSPGRFGHAVSMGWRSGSGRAGIVVLGPS